MSQLTRVTCRSQINVSVFVPNKLYTTNWLKKFFLSSVSNDEGGGNQSVNKIITFN